MFDESHILKYHSNCLNMSTIKKASLDGYGDHVFTGEIAAPYLKSQGLSEDTLESSAWTNDGRANKVAAAVLEWAIAHGASSFCHWFQPLGSGNFRHGQTGQVQIAMVKFTSKGRPVWGFTGDDLLHGETDGSSYLNGGLRTTYSAGGYLCIDPSSPIFLRMDCIFIPAVFVSYRGHALDEKTPLLRATEALSREGVRLLGLLGYHVKSLHTNIGLEQELFLIPRSAYLRRPDLQLTGRTIIGKMCARGQELSDHYMSPISLSSPALACMKEIQQECFKMGIPLRTRHREVAPNQYEFAPMYGSVTTQIDQNIAVMQMIEEIAVKHGLAALLHEKPFQGVNGSGKHNNWSIATDDGTNLLNVQQLAEASGSFEVFPVVMAALVQAIDQYGDLMRMAIASPGNDFRLGACEAPPSIVTTALGESLSRFLISYMKGEDMPYNPRKKLLNMGAAQLPRIEVPAEDRNRTSPFPYGGHRFEFRAVGSSQNVSMVNTVLCTITAHTFKQLADAIEAGTSAKTVAQTALKESWKAVFNGNGYDLEEQAALTAKGCWRYDNGIDAICRMSEPKNVRLFQDMQVLTEEECLARETVMLQHYTGTVEMEALCLVDMIQQHVIPALRATIAATATCSPCPCPSTVTTAGAVNSPSISKLPPPMTSSENATLTHLRDVITLLEHDVTVIQTDLSILHHASDDKTKALKARVLRLDTMESIRETVDAAEALVPAHLWTLATYKELLFLDQHQA